MSNLSLDEKLRIGGYAAPRVRSARTRSIKVVDVDGAVVREIDSQELSLRVLEKQGIEFGVAKDPKRCANYPRCTNKIRNSVLWRARKKGAETVQCRQCLNTRAASPHLPKCSADGCLFSATRGSAADLPRRGVAYCERHRGGQTAARALLPCSAAECTSVATYQSSRQARMRGGKAYCLAHRRGKLARKKPHWPCAVCGNPATTNSRKNAFRKATGAYCEEHKFGKGTRHKQRLPCAVCGSSSTGVSHRNALKRGTRAYCEKHPRGAVATAE